MIRSTRLATVVALSVALVYPAAAGADGLPFPLDTTGSALSSGPDQARFLGIPAGDRTVVLKLDAAGMQVEGRHELRGRYAIPGVAFDGTVGGLSADGRRLTLIKPRRGFPRERTELVVFGTNRLRLLERIKLDGDFSFDAISPDGSTVYLINYIDPRDPRRYEVRAYDVAAAQLDPDPIVDSRGVELTMRGLPVTRVTSRDGAVEYTLYSGGGRTPFVHALNVEDGTAVCLALEMLGSGGTNGATLGLDDAGSMLTVATRKRGPVAAIDTTSYSITEIEPAAAAADGGGLGLPGTTIPALAVGLAAIGVLARARTRRRRRRAASLLDELDFRSPAGPDAEEERTGARVLTRD